MTTTNLERLERNRRRAAQTYATANRERNAAVISAAANGVSVPEIARLLGLTRERVRQIIERG